MQYSEKKNLLGFYEAHPKPSLKELEKHYAETYYQNAQGTYAPDYTPEELRHFSNIAKVAMNTAVNKSAESSLLDLGCGEGFFAKFFFDSGWEVMCCDFSGFGISKHNPDLLSVFCEGDISESIEQLSIKGRKFGLVNLQNVLEHVIDPIDLLGRVRPLLGSNGLLRVRVPNDYSDFQMALLDSGFTTRTWFAPPEHLSYFNKQGLENILQHCAYEIRSLQADFPIEIFLANPHSNYWKDRGLGKGAHMARVFCENHLIERDLDNYVRYTEASAAMGFGRELIAYAAIA